MLKKTCFEQSVAFLKYSCNTGNLPIHGSLLINNLLNSSAIVCVKVIRAK